ncbi:MAG: nuclear transport factor 2 family protein [Vicinamibacterales bacterium]
MISLILALTVLAGQATDDAAVTRELKQMEQQLASSWKNGDCDRWGAIIAPEWSVIHITGTVIKKDEALQMCRQPQVRIETLSIDELTVRVFGNAAVATGRTLVTTSGANAESVTLRVFIRRGGRWQIVASQATRLGA